MREIATENLVIGALASLVGSQAVFLIAPIFLTASLVLLIRFGVRVTQQEYASTRMVLHELFGAGDTAKRVKGSAEPFERVVKESDLIRR